uniref:ATPase subunit 8 n=1 Tax=Crotalus cerberus TaxID=36309 RepID=A0A172QEG5_CROCE|nr:ATPase subunit 8 [Crotalus cerberus]AND82723.1 ATPase subunit 8 [Crotalus cerberus]
MPQLDIVHIFLAYLWAWLTLTLITLKIKTFTMTIKPKNSRGYHSSPATLTLPWT